ncbi:MAG: hypothetical protein KGI04_02025 [Candidatus Micrarchaeota archaeon]|nr:hypothetical protein [Candidatus Micrarchaeota archaeon]
MERKESEEQKISEAQSKGVTLDQILRWERHGGELFETMSRFARKKDNLGLTELEFTGAIETPTFAVYYSTGELLGDHRSRTAAGSTSAADDNEEALDAAIGAQRKLERIADGAIADYYKTHQAEVEEAKAALKRVFR